MLINIVVVVVFSSYNGGGCHWLKVCGFKCVNLREDL
jgi:hypothetical protein